MGDNLAYSLFIRHMAGMRRANFVLVRIGPAHAEFIRALRMRGILVRDRSADPGCEGCVRLTGIFPGRCRQFDSTVKSPHVGWNSLAVKESAVVLRGIAQDSFVYYTHSFHAPLITEASSVCEYGTRFTAAVERNHIFGVQFHPEKSGDVGLAILKNFCEV